MPCDQAIIFEVGGRWVVHPNLCDLARSGSRYPVLSATLVLAAALPAGTAVSNAARSLFHRAAQCRCLRTAYPYVAEAWRFADKKRVSKRDARRLPLIQLRRFPEEERTLLRDRMLRASLAACHSLLAVATALSIPATTAIRALECLAHDTYPTVSTVLGLPIRLAVPAFLVFTAAGVSLAKYALREMNECHRYLSTCAENDVALAATDQSE